LINAEKEIILEEHVSYNAEHIHKNQGQNCRQNDGTAITGHGSDDVQESFLTIHNVEQLKRK
jgi:hypothetical protein